MNISNFENQIEEDSCCPVSGLDPDRGELFCDCISSYKIKMTTDSDEVRFSLKGTGDVTVDFGDGSEKLLLPIDEDDWTEFYRKHPDKALRTITLYGENITELDCSDNQLTSLDISENSVLTEFKHDDDLNVVR